MEGDSEKDEQGQHAYTVPNPVQFWGSGNGECRRDARGSADLNLEYDGHGRLLVNLGAGQHAGCAETVFVSPRSPGQTRTSV